MLKQGLQQKLQQKLSPQQIQLIKLLEVPTIELEQRIKKEIEENPVLEEGYAEEDGYSEQEQQDDGPDEAPDIDEFSLEDYMDEDEPPSYRLNANNHSKDDKRVEIPFSEGSSFYEHLRTQLGLRDLTDRQLMLADYLLGNLDEDGYLRRELDAIADDLAFNQGISNEEAELVPLLKAIQTLEPAGVGARDLQECLVLQVERRSENLRNELQQLATTPPPKGQEASRDAHRRWLEDKALAAERAHAILSKCFQEFAKKHYSKIVGRLRITEADLKEAVEMILKLNPKPGSSFGSGVARNLQQIVPDFILESSEGELKVSLNSKNAPELRISSTYRHMLEGYSKKKGKDRSKEERDTIVFVKQKLDSAKWFIDAIKQRQNTLMKTIEAILEYQKEYFREGDETQLKPMILKDIAEETGLDISTISRVANSKYIQTHFGIHPLKYFFSEGMQTDSGEEVSTREIKSILQTCIESESKKRPLTDNKLSEILKEKGYRIARRTVAKYREQMNIPVARLRIEL